MKKFTLSIFLLALTFVLTLPAFGAVPQLGDLNDDGTADLADAVLALKALGRGEVSAEAAGLEKADFNVDGRIGLEEAIFLLQGIAGLREIELSVALRTGTVALPAGWPAGLPLTSLVVHAELGSSAVGEDGSFSVPLSGAGDALAVVTNAAGTPLMIGCLTDSGSNLLDVQSTAVVLLFHALGLYTQPPSAWADIRSLIAAAPETAALTATIAERLALDPEAIVKGDQAIADAILAAVNAIAAAGTEGLQRPSANFSGSPRSPQSGDVTHVKIDGANPRSGVSIVLDQSGNGITARNEFRRHVLVLVYRTGWEDKDGNRHDTPWELIEDGPFAPVAKGAYLGATNAVGGVVSSLIDLANGNGAYTPSFWDAEDAIPLPMHPGIDPELIAKTFYRVVCVGDAQGDDPEAERLPDDLRPVSGEVIQAMTTMRFLEFFKEFLLPVVFAVIPGEKIAANLYQDKNFVLAAIDIVNFFCSMIPDVATNYAAGQYKNAGLAVVKAFASNGTLFKKSGALLVKLGIVKGLSAATQASIAGAAEKVFAVLSIADKAIAAFDLSVLMTHLASSRPFEQWDATAVWPQVRVQPKPATVESGKSVQLMVTVGGETGNSDKYFYKFTWTTPGEHGKIVNPAGPAPAGTEVVMTSRSPGARINYESAFDAESGAEDRIQVVIHRVSGDGAAKLGNDETTVTVSGSHVELDPATADVEPGGSQAFTSTVKPEPDEEQGDVYYYRWENSALYGHLSGGQDAFESTTVKNVTYEAGSDKEGVDSVSLTVYRKRGGVRETEPLGIASAMVNVRQKHAVQLTPQGKKLAPGGNQVYTATLVPEPEAGVQLVYTWSNTATAGTLTGSGGTDHFEQSGNQATYTAGQAISSDAITVKVERISGGERFLLAEASVGVIVGDFTLMLEPKYNVDQGKGIGIWADVTPYPLPADTYFKWTRTGQKGQLQAYDSGDIDLFESAYEGAYYRANSNIPSGSDTVTVEMYVKRGGTPVLLGSAECKVLVKGSPVLMNAVVRSAVAWHDYQSYDTWPGWQTCYSLFGRVTLSWHEPEDFTPGSYSISIDPQGNDMGIARPYYTAGLQSYYGEPGASDDDWQKKVIRDVYNTTILPGEKGVVIKPFGGGGWCPSYQGSNGYGTLDEYMNLRNGQVSATAAAAAGWIIQVYANP
ncbi:MAG: dockerin type I repeat-containing protein [Deltaproteobacteria bacterium]|nr:dockerin type I repeat-containing protein [Deltaproteobacteria bacterium]